jgi:hypothetical protein
MKWTRKFVYGLAALYCAAVGAVLICLLVVANRPPTGAQAEQERIVAAIQAFRQQHGRLPNTLEETGIDFDRNIFDSVIYVKDFSNPNEFTIDCSRYFYDPTPRSHHWYYSSERGTWEYRREFEA